MNKINQLLPAVNLEQDGQWTTGPLFMAALRSRCGHYICILSFLLSFFPRLISAVADWMSTILRHIIWS